MIWVGINGLRSNVARHKSGVVVIQPTATIEPALVETKKEKRITNILLLGSDQRAGDNGFRTDVILLVSINQDTGIVSVVSFPRDTWVDASGLWEMKINIIFGMAGFEALADTFENNFGVKPDYYLMTNFDGFTGIIDSLDGVDVEVGETLTDDCDLPQQRDGDCTVEPGTVHMDGPTALWYVRSRHTSSDYDRMRRMQEVTVAVFNRLMRMQAMRQIPEIYERFSNSVETNMGVKDILPLLQIASAVFSDPDRISKYTIAEEYTTEMISWDGMWILLPDLEAIKAMLKEAGVE
jgi:LCP family protein required for cell wall assembly